MIKITVSNEGIPLVWDPGDWCTLRRDYRILGNFTGFENGSTPEKRCGLPLILFPFEATLLSEKKIARLVRYPSLSRAPGKGVFEEYQKYRQKILNEQVQYLHCALSEKDQLDANKQPLSFLPSRDISTLCGNITSSNSGVFADSIKVQIFTTYPWLRSEDACSVKWRYPSSRVDVLRFKVYKDLWEKGYYVTSGQNFGADFLVYPGDPYVTHSNYLVVCVDKNGVIRPADIAVLCRLGGAVQKCIMLASQSIQNLIVYQSLKNNVFLK